MKKYILSAVTIVVFGLYSLSIKSDNAFYQAIIPTSTTSNTENSNNTSNTTEAVSTKPTEPIIKPNSKWKDGTYVGDSVDAYYGNVQVSIQLSGDKITNITFLDYPQDRQTSLQKSSFAMPILKSEAIKSQSAYVNSVSGVSYTSQAFKESLTSALNQAKI